MLPSNTGCSSNRGMEIESNAVVDVLPVERQYSGIANVEPRAAQHPELDGHIEDEDLLKPRGRLDFNQAPAACRQTLEHGRRAPAPARARYARLEQRARSAPRG